MAHQEEQRTLLGEMIAKRLTQLGMSRREFCRRFNVSRPTLHDLEFNREKSFAPSTLAAIDEGLKWEAGTSYAFHVGAEPELGLTDTERIESYLEQIVSRLLTMDIDELERETLMLEEELYGRPLASDEASLEVVRATVARLVEAMHGENRTRDVIT